jgi:uncharacterized protein YlxW (UPF0749 family)
MQIYRLIFVFLLILLTGCDQQKIDKLTAEKKSLEDKVFQLQNKNQEAQAKIDQDYAIRKAEFDELEYQAGIAAGCRYFFNVCSASVTAPGDSAQKSGYSGGGTPIFWAIYLSKCLFVLAVFFLGLVSWKHLARPTLHAQKHADMELDKTRQSIEREKARLERTQDAVWQAEKKLKEADYVLKKKEADILEKEDRLTKLNEDLKAAEAAKQALTSFKF